MSTHRTRSILILALVAMLGACAEPATDTGELPYPSDLADQESPWELEKQAIVDRLVERRPVIRDLLSEGVVGEASDGYLAEPPDTEAIITAEHVAIMLDDNADRAALYEVIARKSVLESLQEQADDITYQVVVQVCPQLEDQGLPCDEDALSERVYQALDAAIAGEPLPAEDSIDAVVTGIVDPIVQSTVQVVTTTVLPIIRAKFAREYQKRAPSGTWIEVDGQWGRRN